MTYLLPRKAFRFTSINCSTAAKLRHFRPTSSAIVSSDDGRCRFKSSTVHLTRDTCVSRRWRSMSDRQTSCRRGNAWMSNWWFCKAAHTDTCTWHAPLIVVTTLVGVQGFNKTSRLTAYQDPSDAKEKWPTEQNYQQYVQLAICHARPYNSVNDKANWHVYRGFPDVFLCAAILWFKLLIIFVAFVGKFVC